MAIKSVLLGAICEDKPPSEYVVNYAIDLAAQERAHLAIGVCVPKIATATGLPFAHVRGLIAGANAERRQMANEFSKTYRRIARLAGVTVSTNVIYDTYVSARDRLVRFARVNDLTVTQRSDGILSLEKGLVERLLFHSGRSVLVVPPAWKQEFRLGTIIVAWDGGERAARAVGDAMHFLAKASAIEIVCVSGDTRDDKVIEGAEIAEHLSRHCKAVTTTDLSATGGDVAGAILSHAKKKQASLLVMGGFAHSRFEEMLLGGVTQSMLSASPLPTFLSF